MLYNSQMNYELFETMNDFSRKKIFLYEMQTISGKSHGIETI